MKAELLDDSKALDNIEDYEYATYRSRVWATILDTLVIIIPVVLLLFYNLLVLQNLIVEYLITASYSFYKIYMEGTFGYTLGKKWAGIRIIKLDDSEQNMDIKTAIARYSVYFPYLIVQMLVTFYVFDAGALQAANGIDEIFFVSDELDLNEPSFLKILNGLSSLLLFVSTLFIFQGTKKQALHDKIANTVCIKLKK